MLANTNTNVNNILIYYLGRVLTALTDPGLIFEFTVIEVD